MRFDVVVGGGGTAGCVHAARLSENPDRRVCLLEAGPDYGLLGGGRWPAEILDARAMPTTHDWGAGGEDGRTLGARILGGSSSHNACMMLSGSPADYDEWGADWAYERFRPFLERARATLRTAPRNTEQPAPFQLGFVDAAESTGFTVLADPDDPDRPVGVAPFPANVAGGTRWNAALAYLEPARSRRNLVVAGDTLVDRVTLDGVRTTGVVAVDGRRFEAETVVLAAGAYFSPAILARSGIGPERDLRRLGIPVVEALPVGERLLDHCGTGIAWEPSSILHARTAQHDRESGLFEAHAVLKAASSHCEPGSWDIHVLPWTNATAEPGRYEVSAGLYHMKPRSTGRVRLRSTDPAEAPVVERGFLSHEADLPVLLETIELARAIASSEPLRGLLTGELRPAGIEPERYVRETVRNYFHPAGTCGIGVVVDPSCRVLGIEGLVVADGSVMPTIPRANTNLTTAAIAQRIAETL